VSDEHKNLCLYPSGPCICAGNDFDPGDEIPAGYTNPLDELADLRAEVTRLRAALQQTRAWLQAHVRVAVNKESPRRLIAAIDAALGGLLV
jgi:hypothetical protein